MCTQLNTAIGENEQDSKDILLSYYPAANPPLQGTSLLDLFSHWCRAMLTLLVFTFQKTAAAIDFVQSYEHLTHVVSRTGPLLQSLDLGISDRKEEQISVGWRRKFLYFKLFLIKDKGTILLCWKQDRLNCRSSHLS